MHPLIAAPEWLAKLDALILHGDQDTTLPLVWAERSAELLEKLGVSFESRRSPARHEITSQTAGDFVAWIGKMRVVAD